MPSIMDEINEQLWIETEQQQVAGSQSTTLQPEQCTDITGMNDHAQWNSHQ